MNNEQTVPVPLTGDDYYGEGKCHVCQNDIAIKVNGRFYDKIVGDLVTGFNNGFKAARKLNANHAALVDAAWKVIIAHQMGHETPEQADKIWAEEKASLLNLQTALEALTNDQPPGEGGEV